MNIKHPQIACGIKASQMAFTACKKRGMFEEKISTHSFFRMEKYGGTGVTPVWEWQTESNEIGNLFSKRLKMEQMTDTCSKKTEGNT